MAKRNRKNGEEGHRTMVWGISLFGVAAVLAGIYLGLFNACETIGRQIKKLEYDQAELRKRVVNEERNWAMARSIGNMERLMAAHEGRMESLAKGGARWSGQLPRARRVARKALTATEEETARNPRARSAKLRVLERMA